MVICPARAVERATLLDELGNPAADLAEHHVQVAPDAWPAVHRSPFDEGILDHVEQALVTGVLLGELLGHAEIREGHMAQLVIQIANQALLKILIQRLGNRRQHDLCAVGPGIVALADDLHTELLGECSRQPFKLAFE